MRFIEADVYAFCDQDDIWFPNKLSLMHEKTCNYKPNELFMAYSDLQVTDENLNVINESFLRANASDQDGIQFEDALLRGLCPGCVMLFSKGLRDIVIDICNTNSIYMHDWWMFALATGCNSSVIYIKKPTMYYRQHSHNTLGYHKRSLRNVLYGISPMIIREFIQEKKAWTKRPYMMARELHSNCHLTKTASDFCIQLIQAHEKKKIDRIRFYITYYKGSPNIWLRLLFV